MVTHRPLVVLVGLALVTATLPHPGLAALNAWSTQGPPGGFVQVLAVDPHDSRTLYAGSRTNYGFLFRSTDAGATWHEVRVTSQRAGVNAMAFDPVHAGTIYVAFEALSVYKSIDHGASWDLADDGIAASSVNALAIDPADTRVVYAGTSAGVFRSIDGGGSWSPSSAGLTSLAIATLEIDELQPNVIYAGTGNAGIFKSDDRGDHWIEINDGLPDQTTRSEIVDIAIEPQTSDTLYLTGTGGVFKSTDGGASWQRRSSGFVGLIALGMSIDRDTPNTLYVGSGYGIFKSTNAGDTWAAVNTGLPTTMVLTIAAPRGAPNTLYLGTMTGGGGIFKTTTGGESWNVSHQGIVNTSVQALATDPVTPGVIYAGTLLDGVYRSTNGGTSWLAVNDFLLDTDVTALAIDPGDASTVVAGTSESRSAGIFMSTSRGDLWGYRGLPNGDTRTLAIARDPLRTIYVGTRTQGVWKTVNDGSLWTPVNEGLLGVDVAALAVDPLAQGTLYAALSGHGVFKSVDGGGEWTNASTGLTTTGLTALAINADAPGTIYAATSGGVFKTTNGASSWSRTSLFDPWVTSIAVDAVATETVYAASGGQGVWISTNGGETWTAFGTDLLDGEAFKDVRVIAADAVQSGVVYAGTRRGVYGIGLALVTTPTPTVTMTPPKATATVTATVPSTPTASPTPDAVRTVLPGPGCCTTDADDAGPTSMDPVETTVCLPSAGECAIGEAPASQVPRIGYSVVGQAITITAPDATANEPLVLLFTIDASQLPAGQTWTSVQIFRNDDVVRTCIGRSGQATPDPCVTRRRLTADGDVELTVLSSAASVWTPVVSSLEALLCYATKAPKGAAAFEPALGTRLADAVPTLLSGALVAGASTTFDLVKPGTFCAPVGVDGGAVRRPAVGFQEYRVKLPKTCTDDGHRCVKAADCNPGASCEAQARKVCADDGAVCKKPDECTAPAKCVAHKKFVAAADVVVTSALGQMALHLGKPSGALIPTARAATGPLPAGAPIDRYKCYDVKVAKNVCMGNPARGCVGDASCGDDGPCFPGFSAGRTVRLHGDLTPVAKSFVVKRPTALCVPASDGAPLAVPSTALQCFAVKPTAGQPKHAATAFTSENAFGPLPRVIGKESELCLPAEAILKGSR